MRFDKTTAKQMREVIERELIALGKKHGVEFHVGSCKFTDHDFIYKLEVKSADPKEQEAVARREFESYCRLFGFEASDFGREFVSHGEKWTIAGLVLNRAKYNLRANRVSDGKQMLFVASQIAPKLHPKEAAHA